MDAGGIIFIVLLVLGLGATAGMVGYRRLMRLTQGRPREWWRAWRGKGMGVDDLARRLDLSEAELRSAQPSWHTAYVPKRRRNAGSRELTVPDAQTKRLQRRILRRLLSRLRTHVAVVGFERGLSIVHNAAPHVRQAVVIRLDIVDFFHNTTADRVEAYFRRIGWNADAASLLTRLTTHQGRLPQGAPTSPRLSNLVNFALDATIEAHVARRRGIYTRYADDITISFPRDYPRKVRGTIQYVGRVLKRYGYRLHRRPKQHIRRRHQQQNVTGLVVNERIQLPRRTRRWLRAVEHRLATGGEASLTEAQLQGWRAFQAMVARQRDQLPPMP